jgi:uncharacterized membrane protein
VRQGEEDRLEKRIARLEERLDQLAEAVQRMHERGPATNERPGEGDDAAGGTEKIADTAYRTRKQNPAERSKSSHRDPVDREVPVPSTGTSTASRGHDLPGKAGGWLKSVLGTTTEDWLSRLGIALLLFGLAFLFRYAVEQNWLGPAVRVAFGAGMGGALFAGGLRLHDARPRFGQVLLGGSAATFYVTIFSAYQLYGLLDYLTAFAAMLAVTGLTFTVAVRQDEAVMAVIGAVGAYATPFLLYTDAGSIPGLVGYAVIVLALTISLFGLREWVVMLHTSIAGMWIVTITGWVSTVSLFGGEEAARLDRIAVQVSATIAWLAAAALPFAYRMIRSGACPVPRTFWLPRWVGDADATDNTSSVRQATSGGRSLWSRAGIVLSAFSSPLLLVGITAATWNLTDGVTAALMAGLAIVYVPAARWSHEAHLRVDRALYSVLAALLVTAAIGTGLDGPYLTVVLAVQGSGLLLLTNRGAAPALRYVAHGLLFLVAAEAVHTDLGRSASDVSTSGGRLAMAALIFGSAWIVGSRRVRAVYLGTANLMFAVGAWHGFEEPAHDLDLTRSAWLMQALMFWGLRQFLDRGTRLSARPLRHADWVVHSLVLLTSVSLASDLWMGPAEPILSVSNAIEGLVIGGLALASVRSGEGLRFDVFKIAVLVLWLAWTGDTFGPLDGGAGIVSAIWCGTALAGIVAGSVWDRSNVRYAGFATLLLVVGKLFLIDLSALSPVWRIMIFLGFGVALLAVGYLLPGILPGTSDADGTHASEAADE